MTIVCGYERDGEVWVGSDSRTVSGTFIYPETIRKFARLGRWTLGFAGSGMTLALIERKAEIATLDDPAAVGEAVMAVMREAGYRQCTDHPGPPCFEQQGLLASASRVWGISGNGQVWSPDWGFVAIGSGDNFAYGAAHVAHDLKVRHAHVVRFACEAAIAFDAGCGGEIVVERVERVV